MDAQERIKDGIVVFSVSAHTQKLYCMHVGLIKERPTNSHQPYMKIGFTPLILAKLKWLEYLAEVKGYFTDKGKRTSFEAKGIAEDMDAIW